MTTPLPRRRALHIDTALPFPAQADTSVPLPPPSLLRPFIPPPLTLPPPAQDAFSPDPPLPFNTTFPPSLQQQQDRPEMIYISMLSPKSPKRGLTKETYIKNGHLRAITCFLPFLLPFLRK